jgi:glycerol-3-phosphate acyltransferase PlsY
MLTLVLDALKGWLPVVLVKWYGARYGLAEGTLALVGLAAFLGHLYPVFFRFVGGKGVATALGVIVGINPWLGLAVFVSFGIVVFFTRYVSLASMVAAVFAPVYYVFGDGVAWYADNRVLLSMTLMSGLLVWRHYENINRLLKGTESRLGQKKPG